MSTVVSRSRDQRVLVIGLSPVKNAEVVGGLRDLGIDALGCTEPDTAAQRHDARDFEMIVFGRAAMGPGAERLKRAFSQQDPNVVFVDAFGPIAVEQVASALQRRPGSPVLVDNLSFATDDRGGQITASVSAPCHIAMTLYSQSTDGTLEEKSLRDGDFAAGHLTCPVAGTELFGAYSLVVVVNLEEFHHLPFL